MRDFCEPTRRDKGQKSTAAQRSKIAYYQDVLPGPQVRPPTQSLAFASSTLQSSLMRFASLLICLLTRLLNCFRSQNVQIMSGKIAQAVLSKEVDEWYELISEWSRPEQLNLIHLRCAGNSFEADLKDCQSTGRRTLLMQIWNNFYPLCREFLSCQFHPFLSTVQRIPLMRKLQFKMGSI